MIEIAWTSGPRDSTSVYPQSVKASRWRGRR